MNLEDIWADYGLDGLQEGMDRLFPQYDLSLSALLERLLQGDVIGALTDFFKAGLADMAGSTVEIGRAHV